MTEYEKTKVRDIIQGMTDEELIMAADVALTEMAARNIVKITWHEKSLVMEEA